jgi:hypothetical protein
MSSSGLIYAFIVGAWAVYLVPMWLRREDELNKARQTQRYTTAIKVLSNKDSFERKHGNSAEQAAEHEEARRLPVASGQSGAAPAAGQRTLDRVREKERERGGAGAGRERAGERERSSAGGVRPKTAVAASSATAAATAVSASVPTASAAGSGAGSAGHSATSAAASSSARSGLRARRRRVVGVLFGLTSLGAIVSADLGLSYVWAMLLPAAVLSAYIMRVRKDERALAIERARRRNAAVKAARETERRRVESEREQEEAVRLEREELALRNAVARRRVAAARSRADRRTVPGPTYGTPGGTPHGGRPDQGDLPRAANG